MSFRDVVGFVYAAKDDEPVIQALEALGGGENRAQAVLVAPELEAAYFAEGVFAMATWAQLREQRHAGFAKEQATLEQRCRTALFPIALRTLAAPASLVGTEAAARARHGDISVMLRPGGADPKEIQKEFEGEIGEEIRSAVFEAVLFGSGRPVLLIPPQWRPGAIGRRIVVGWNGRREAARALGDAMPLLRDANQVSVVTVDAHGELDGSANAPGEDITAHLLRTGVKATLRKVDGLGRDSGEALLAEAKALGADLIVIGGYGTPRLREFVFGGVTRTLSAMSDIPVLLSH